MIGFDAIRGLLLLTSRWVRRHQQAVIDYLLEENRVLQEQRNGKRLVLTDDQRRRLAARGKAIGRRDLKLVATIVKADTVLAWHRKLIEQRCSAPERRPGRPRVPPEIRHLVVRMALENAGWGYRRIQGELKALGLGIARSTIADILRENGIKPAPDRPTSWMAFIKAHWGCAAESVSETPVATERQADGIEPLGSPNTGARLQCVKAHAGHRGLRNRSRVRQALHAPQFNYGGRRERNRFLFDRQPRAA